MKNRIWLFILVVGFLFGTIVSVHAQQAATPKSQSKDRIDLKTETLVGKTLDEVVDGANGKEYRYTYRVQAKPTEQEMPRYAVNPQYDITYTKEGFQEKDSVTLLSANTESGTDSPIWVYQVTYVGSGERKISFDTAGSAMVPMFATANSETENPCDICGQDPCVCDDSDPCDVCGQDPCVCDDNDPCEVCGEYPCVCDNSCGVCGQDPCACTTPDAPDSPCP